MTPDENEILADQDQTLKKDLLVDDENMGAKTKSLDPLEDEPEDFVRGDLDVKEQMDRATDAVDASLYGYQNQSYEDSPRGELNSSFRNTPGGLEEVEMKTDEALARAHHHPHAKKRPPTQHR
jgi:hypothetical protein